MDLQTKYTRFLAASWREGWYFNSQRPAGGKLWGPAAGAELWQQCCRFRPNIAQVTPKNIYVYIKKKLQDQSIPKKKFFFEKNFNVWQSCWNDEL